MFHDMHPFGSNLATFDSVTDRNNSVTHAWEENEVSSKRLSRTHNEASLELKSGLIRNASPRTGHGEE
jgi:hypothetical protein